MGHMTPRKLHLPQEYIDISNVCNTKNLMIYNEIKTELDQWSPYRNYKKKKKYNNDWKLQTYIKFTKKFVERTGQNQAQKMRLQWRFV